MVAEIDDKKADGIRKLIIIIFGFLAGLLIAIIINYFINEIVKIFGTTLIYFLNTSFGTDIPQTDKQMWLIGVAMKAPLVSFALFWMYGYAGNLIQGTRNRSNSDKTHIAPTFLTISTYHTFLFTWCFWCSVSVYITANMTADIVTEMVIDTFHETKELHIVYADEPELQPVPRGPYVKMAWHFFFEEGNLARSNNILDAKTACQIGNLETRGSRSGTTIRRYLNGLFASNETYASVDKNHPAIAKLDDIDLLTVIRISDILKMTADCVADSKKVSENSKMLALTVSSSGRGWSQCTNDEELDTELKTRRANKIKTLFDRAKVLSATRYPAETGVIQQLALNDRDSAQIFDFSDVFYKEQNKQPWKADNSSRKIEEAKPSPHYLSQVATIVLDNPQNCKNPLLER